MRVHELKCWPEPFQATAFGLKVHDFRRDDRGFEVGDVVRLCEWEPNAPESVDAGHYTGQRLLRVITYLSRGPQWGIPEGFVVLSFGAEEVNR